MSGKRKMDQADIGVGAGGVGANRRPHHQPVEGAAGFSGMVDPQFVKMRTTMRDKIFNYIGRKPASAEWRKRLPELAKRLEEILHRRFPNMIDYCNMMKGPLEPQLQFAIKTLSDQNKQGNPQVERQTPPSSSSNLSGHSPTIQDLRIEDLEKKVDSMAKKIEDLGKTVVAMAGKIDELQKKP